MTDERKCPSCGVPWTDHLGITGTCAKLQEALGVNQSTIYARALEHYGSMDQMGQCIEECVELIVALRQFKRGRVTGHLVAEEVADVLIMAEQMRLIFGAADVDEAKRMKLARLEKRMDGGQK